MSTRKPAVTTLLKKANERIVELEKQLAQATATKDSYYASSQKSDQELEQIHSFMDAIPGAIPRQNEQNYRTNSPMTRIAAWLATK